MFATSHVALSAHCAETTDASDPRPHRAAGPRRGRAHARAPTTATWPRRRGGPTRRRPTWPTPRPGSASSTPRSSRSRPRPPPRRPRSTRCATPCGASPSSGSSTATPPSTRYSDPDINTQARAEALSKYATQGNQDAIDAFDGRRRGPRGRPGRAGRQARGPGGRRSTSSRSAASALEREFERLEALEKERQEAERKRRAAAAARGGRVDHRRVLVAAVHRRASAPSAPIVSRAGRRDHLPGAGPGGLQRHLGRVPLRRTGPQGRRHARRRWARPPSRR